MEQHPFAGTGTVQLLLHVLPVLHELLEPRIRERVMREPFKYLVGNRRDVRTQLRSFHDVARMPRGGNQHFGIKVVVTPNLHDLCDERHAVLTRIIQASDEGADDGGTRLGGEERLVCGEHQRAVGADFLLPAVVQGLEALDGHRDFHHHVLVPAVVFLGLLLHPLEFRGSYLRTHAGDEFAHLHDRLFEVLPLLGNERRVRRDSIEHAPRGDLCDLINVSGIEEELHKKTMEYEESMA